ncbi:unnamed protein product [Brassicogethes aeneus]|uniref:Uncharacterized protein n=1 Tax=Brassicogethes aeneus TaxID=1431903 RepID=A0A9P0BBJ5_BRAAE|nr:unnamed protein product [Brassicogethes aeneus]
MNGKLLVLPIQGSGDFELDFFNGTNFFSFDLEKEVKDEVTYGKITNAQYDYEVGLVQMNFDNLFNGDKVLGPQTNKFLNENWQDVLKDVDGSLKDAVSKVWELVLGNYFSRIPYKDLFLD